MQMFVIYKGPADYPHEYVVRRWYVGENALLADDDPLLVTKNWTEVAEYKHANHPLLVVIPRDPSDDLSIQEVWV